MAVYAASTCEDMSRWNGPSLGLDSTVRIFCFIIWRWGTIQSTPLVMVPMTEQVQTFSPTPRRPGSRWRPPEMLSYLLGVVCHFTLDAACHGYVEKKIQKSGASHIQIEMEFDRYLMCACLDRFGTGLPGIFAPPMIGRR